MSIDMINKEKENVSKVKIIYKADELQNDRANKLNQAYNNQKQDFNRIINPVKPEEI